MNTNDPLSDEACKAAGENACICCKGCFERGWLEGRKWLIQEKNTENKRLREEVEDLKIRNERLNGWADCLELMVEKARAVLGGKE